mmetsp:Transcript_3925/g.13113  ORF Transcript_3925/g.13113 Transcript_3925/m.13113 type:complete len:257 (-) Transcript_3925:76-846(-)
MPGCTTFTKSCVTRICRSRGCGSFSLQCRAGKLVAPEEIKFSKFILVMGSTSKEPICPKARPIEGSPVTSAWHTTCMPMSSADVQYIVSVMPGISMRCSPTRRFHLQTIGSEADPELGPEPPPPPGGGGAAEAEATRTPVWQSPSKSLRRSNCRLKWKRWLPEMMALLWPGPTLPAPAWPRSCCARSRPASARVCTLPSSKNCRKACIESPRTVECTTRSESKANYQVRHAWQERKPRRPNNLNHLLVLLSRCPLE